MRPRFKLFLKNKFFKSGLENIFLRVYFQYSHEIAHKVVRELDKTYSQARENSPHGLRPSSPTETMWLAVVFGRLR